MEKGRVDIIIKVSMMAYPMAITRNGQFEAVFNVFIFLCQKYNSKMEFHPTYPAINISEFKECKWKDLHGKLK